MCHVHVANDTQGDPTSGGRARSALTVVPELPASDIVVVLQLLHDDVAALKVRVAGMIGPSPAFRWLQLQHMVYGSTSSVSAWERHQCLYLVAAAVLLIVISLLDSGEHLCWCGRFSLRVQGNCAAAARKSRPSHNQTSPIFLRTP